MTLRVTVRTQSVQGCIPTRSVGTINWLARPETPQSLSFTCELGPPPYAITGADGRELSDRWAEALKLQRLIREVWQRCQAY